MKNKNRWCVAALAWTFTASGFVEASPTIAAAMLLPPMLLLAVLWRRMQKNCTNG